MTSNHLIHCLVGTAAGVGLLLVLGVQAGTLVYLAVVLACPLMMVFMMRGMMRGDSHGGCDHPDHQHTDPRVDNEATERTR